MAWFSSLFDRNDEPQIPVIPPAPPVPFTASATASLDSLATAARRASATVSPHVYSQLRTFDDVLRPVLAHAALHPVSIDQEIAIESLIADYVPTALALFCQLPSNSQGDGGPADTSLRSQYTTLERSARRLAATIFGDSEDALSTHAIFIQTKFGS